MRISDWSSDVCSSDLPAFAEPVAVLVEQRGASGRGVVGDLDEIAELVAELHEHAVLLAGPAAPAVLLAAVLLAAGHHSAQAEADVVVGTGDHHRLQHGGAAWSERVGKSG